MSAESARLRWPQAIACMRRQPETQALWQVYIQHVGGAREVVIENESYAVAAQGESALNTLFDVPGPKMPVVGEVREVAENIVQRIEEAIKTIEVPWAKAKAWTDVDPDPEPEPESELDD